MLFQVRGPKIKTFPKKCHSPRGKKCLGSRSSYSH